MNICIDMRPALSSPTGVGVYLLNLVAALSTIDRENRYHLFSSSWKQRYPPHLYGRQFQLHDRRWPVRLLNVAWNRMSWPPIETLLGTAVDIAHSPTPLVIPAKRARRITTVHDLYFHEYPDQTVREVKRDYAALVRKHCGRSDAIITVSEYTKHRLVETLNIPASKIYSIHHGADSYYAEPAAETETNEVRKKLGITRPYFLFVGTKEPRKNLPLLLEAFRDLSQDVELVLAGPEGWGEEPWRNLVTGRVRVSGYVTKAELRALYQGSTALIVPSKDEGFGLPLLEAMAAGAPVIVSDIPVFREIGNEACLRFDAGSGEALREAMQKVLDDSNFRQTFIQKGRDRVKHFSWLETARKTLELYQNL